MTQARTALVTGGAKRIGAAIVRDLAGHGLRVAIHCNRSTREAKLWRTKSRAAGGQAAVIRGGPRRCRSVAPQIVPDGVGALGPLTLLVNNARCSWRTASAGWTIAVWQTQFDVNLRAPVFLAEAFAAQLPDGMRRQHRQHDRPARLEAHAGDASYTLTKAALWTATQTLAQALAPRIRVNGIGPGPTFPNAYAGDDGMTKEIDGHAARDARVDVGRFRTRDPLPGRDAVDHRAR